MASRAVLLSPRERLLLHDRNAPRVASATVALPAQRCTQEELFARLVRRWQVDERKLAKLEGLHKAVGVASRCMALPLDEYDAITDFGKANDAYIRVGTELGARAVREALSAAGRRPDDVGAIFFTTVTGIAVPTIDARLANVLGLRRSVRRVPMFGLGCVGGAAGLARTADHLRAYPEDVAVLLSVELCSLTIQNELSVANLIASGLFGDGAAAVVLTGAHAPSPHGDVDATATLAPRVLGSRSAFFPDTERVMGWDVGSGGFKVVLSADVPSIARTHLPPEVDAFLADHGLSRSDIQHWVCHPGGPKVIAAIEESLGLPQSALAATRRSLSEVGNLSSGSVLHVLSQTLARAVPGDLGVLMAMGPGFCAEMVLLAW